MSDSIRRSQCPASSRFLAPTALFATITLAACGAGDGFGPTDDPAAPAVESPAPAASPEAAPAMEPLTALTAQRIVFSSTRKGSYDIFKMDPLGGNVARLTTFGSWETEPVWSRDNQRIALLRPRRDASNVSHSDIWIMNSDGTNGHWARPTTVSYDLQHPAWSPDGKRIVSAVIIGGTPFLAMNDLVTGKADFVRYQGQPVYGNYPSFDPAGKWIIYVPPGGRGVDKVNTDGTIHLGVLTTTGTISEPRFSPDGTKIAYEMLSGVNIDIYVRTLATGVTKRLTSNAAIDEQATWSPDGSRIAFMSTRSGHAQIYVMDAATGGNVARITKTATEEKDPSWSH